MGGGGIKAGPRREFFEVGRGCGVLAAYPRCQDIVQHESLDLAGWQRSEPSKRGVWVFGAEGTGDGDGREGLGLAGRQECDQRGGALRIGGGEGLERGEHDAITRRTGENFLREFDGLEGIAGEHIVQRGFQSGGAVGEVGQALGPGQGGGCVAGGPNIGERPERVFARQARGHGGEALHCCGEFFAGEAVEEQAVEVGFVAGADEFTGEREGAFGVGAREGVERGDEGRGAFGSERQRADVGEGEFGFAGQEGQKGGAEFLGAGARIWGNKGSREVRWVTFGFRRYGGGRRCGTGGRRCSGALPVNVESGGESDEGQERPEGVEEFFHRGSLEQVDGGKRVRWQA